MPQIINGTWADVVPGHWVLNDREMTLWEVLQVRDGWVQLRGLGGLPIARNPDPTSPVCIVVPTAGEADSLVRGELGAQTLEG
jgi:hypothetical protein